MQANRSTSKVLVPSDEKKQRRCKLVFFRRALDKVTDCQLGNWVGKRRRKNDRHDRRQAQRELNDRKDRIGIGSCTTQRLSQLFPQQANSCRISEFKERGRVTAVRIGSDCHLSMASNRVSHPSNVACVKAHICPKISRLPYSFFHGWREGCMQVRLSEMTSYFHPTIFVARTIMQCMQLRSQRPLPLLSILGIPKIKIYRDQKYGTRMPSIKIDMTPSICPCPQGV